jgi:hypothetical protein
MPEIDMPLGPRMQGEAALAAQVQRAALFSTFAKAIDMEKILVRAATPVVGFTRLVYPGHCQFSYRGHATGLAPRDCRRAIRAAQPRLQTAPILQRPTSSTSSAYPPALWCSVF